MSTEPSPMAKKLSHTQLKSRQEIDIPITIRGLWKGWEKITHRAPLKFYQNTARRIEGLSKKLMTGGLVHAYRHHPAQQHQSRA
ncbi:MAG: hypothetical protein OXT65_11145 [Alphaproteobacteria bacterium]|nr:hypothetical protein [Alphaproteobacteria bacterium]